MKPSARNPLPPWPALACVVALVCGFAQHQALAQNAPQVRLPALGEAAADDFGIGVERRLGDQIMREVRRDPDYLDDPVLVDYLASLWRPLVAAARQRGDIGADTEAQFAWEAFLVRDRSVNAFALPGGFVGVHLGLIAMTASRDELASVLAHELSHVTQRHIARSMVSSQRQSMLGLAAIILGVLAASRSGNSDIAQAAVMGGQAGMIQGQLNFSRDMEREADRIGFGVLSVAGFAPAGMAAMFEKLEVANRLNDSGAFPYLRSHPLTIERVGEARARVALPQGPVPLLGTLDHTLMQARARALMDASVVAQRRLQEQLDAAPTLSFNERLGALYAGALAASRLRDGARAETAVADALRLLRSGVRREPRAEAAFQLLQAQLLLERGAGAQAAQVLQGLGDAAGTRAPLLLRAQAALAQQRERAPGAEAALRSSTEALQTWVAEHRGDALAWAALGQCAEAAGLRLRALRAQAESHAAIGDIPGAIDRLRAGQALVRTGAANDFIEASVVDSRLRELEGQRRQLAADMRGSRGGRDADAGEPQ